jgi:hypothetical protein
MYKLAGDKEVQERERPYQTPTLCFLRVLTSSNGICTAEIIRFIVVRALENIPKDNVPSPVMSHAKQSFTSRFSMRWRDKSEPRSSQKIQMDAD